MWLTLRKLRACPWGDRWLLLESLLCLGVLRAAILLLPFRTVTRLLRLKPGGEAPPGLDSALTTAAEPIQWAVGAAAARTPWTSTCLVQALAGMVLLRRRGFSGTLYLGTARQPDAPNGISAHAWLRCGTAIVTGAAGREHHVTIATFSAAGP